VEDPQAILPTVAIAARLRAAGAVVVDARSEAEVAAAPPPCPTVFLNTADPGSVAAAISKAKAAGSLPDQFTPIVTFCRSGRRAGVACQQLQGMGYLAVANAGGVDGIKAAVAAAAAQS